VNLLSIFLVGRKHYLQRTSHEYLLKHAHRQSLNSSLPDSPLADALPRGWTLDLQFADELDELLMDELYDLDELMTTPLGEEEGGGKRWFILKPGMSDKGQGIRLFSTREELEEIFVEMESDSEEEEDEEETEDDDDDDDDDESADDQEKEEGQAGESRKEVINPRADIDEGEEDEGTGIASSQLRHFVIQEYLPNPLLLASSSSPSSSPSPPPPAGRKFHIRAYTLLSSAYTFHLARTTLALFSSLPYAPPTSHEESLLPHLTNTCLQPPMSPGEVDEENVHLLWELEGCRVKGWEETKGGGVLTKEILESVWEEVGKVGCVAFVWRFRSSGGWVELT
jgi:tubulin--tyrosine ligase